MTARPDLLVLGLLCCANAGAQRTLDSAIYAVHWRIDGPVLGGGALLALTGVSARASQDAIPETTVNSLQRSAVDAFDRSAFGNIGDRQGALRRSDIVVGITTVAPLMLCLDRRVRKEWKPLIVLYAESMLINTGVQNWTSHITGRYRPLTYLDDVPMNERTDNVNRNSFFSGHTSATATASFFMAKVIDDLHPELGGKRWLVYGAAIVPPALAGWYRMEAGKHFPSDVIAGFTFGAAVGMLVPQFHREDHRNGLTALPFANDRCVGIALSCEW